MNALLRIRTLGAAAALTWAAIVQAQAADLHAIFVIDTDDPNIGTMVAKDLGLVGKEVQTIAAETGLALKDRVYAGRDFTIENVKSAVQTVKPGADDVVLFYYSGHGFRTPAKQSRWPYFYFKSSNTIDFGWVADTLKTKGARLTISLVDACNNVVDVQVREDQKATKAAADAYKELFLRSKGFVTGASSQPGETSIATSNGSLFTIAFLKALHDELGQASPSWDTIMRNGAGKRLSSGGGSQQPIYDLKVSRVSTPTAGTQPPATTGDTATPVQAPQPPTPTVQQPTTPPATPTASAPPTATPTAGTQPPSPPATQPAVPPPPPQTPGSRAINF